MDGYLPNFMSFSYFKQFEIYKHIKKIKTLGLKDLKVAIALKGTIGVPESSHPNA